MQIWSPSIVYNITGVLEYAVHEYIKSGAEIATVNMISSARFIKRLRQILICEQLLGPLLRCLAPKDILNEELAGLEYISEIA